MGGKRIEAARALAHGARWVAQVPVALLALWSFLTAVAVALALANGQVLEALVTVGLTGFATMGALLAARRPDNAVGLILLTVAIIFAVMGVVDGYVDEFVNWRDTKSTSVTDHMALWLFNVLSLVPLALTGILLPLIFPTGRVTSPAGRGVLLLGGALLGAGMIGAAFGSELQDLGDGGYTPALTPTEVHNPLAPPGELGDGLDALERAAGPLLGVPVVAALVGLVLRLRHATGEHRQQLKWFAYVTAAMLFGLAIVSLGTALPDLRPLSVAGWVLFLLWLIAGLPLAIGVAILRYRLYAIDVVIHRTLVYAVLTAVLASVYAAAVVLLGTILAPLTDTSGLAVALSTLAVAALFRPARQRVQAVVDRRFFRERYDAGRTLEAFARQVRDDLDPESVSAHLAGAVHESIHPGHVSVWLSRSRPTKRR